MNDEDRDDSAPLLPGLAPPVNSDGEPVHASAVDERGNKKIRNRQKREQAESDEFWENVFRTPVGRREMWRWLTSLHTFEIRFGATPAGFNNPEHSWVLAGQQDAGLRTYQSWLGRFPELVALMHQENDARFKPKGG